MRIIQGDLLKYALEGRFEVIVHGCNCFCTMGAGIAAGVRKFFPEAYKVDQLTIEGDRSKLGTITYAKTERNGKPLFVVNAYSQYGFGADPPSADYQAIKSAFGMIKVVFRGKTIGYPKIGAGLAGGDWNIIAPIIDEQLENEDHTLVEYVP